MERDQVAFMLADATHAGIVNGRAEVEPYPNLRIQFEECLSPLPDDSFTRLTRPNPHESDDPLTRPQALLRFSEWRDRDDNVGRVAELLIKIAGHG